MGYRKIVIGSDGSATSYRAQHKAVRFARLVGAQVVIVCAHGTSGIDPHTAAENVAKARRSAEQHGVEAATAIPRGEPGEMLAAVAREQEADLIVVGDVGMGEVHRFKLGGVAEHAAHSATCDVLIARTRERQHKSPHAPLYKGIVAGTDGAPTSNEAIRKAFDLGMMLETGVTVVHVGSDRLVGGIVLERAVAAKPDWVPVRSRLVEGEPASKLQEVAHEEDSDLIVVGNRGVVGARRFLLRSVPVQLAHRAKQDVLVAKTVGLSPEDLRPGHGGVVSVNGDKVALYVDESGKALALSARCQHMGCTVDWNEAEKTWDCPCHGSRYALDGEVIHGPATKGLPPKDLDL